MARYNEILTGRHNRFIQKLFGMKGAAPASQLSGDIQMMHPIFHGAENRYLEGWNRFWINMSAAGVAAQFGKVRFRNPKSNNVIVVLEKISAIVSLAGAQILFSVQHNDAGSDLATIINAPQMDFRTNLFSSMVCSQQTTAGADLPILTYIIQAGTNLGSIEMITFEEQEITLLPGDTLQIRDGSANDGFTLSAMWRERALEDSEQK